MGDFINRFTKLHVGNIHRPTLIDDLHQLLKKLDQISKDKLRDMSAMPTVHN